MAVTVTETIKSIMAARDAQIITGQDAILQLLVELRRQVVTEIATLPAEGFSSYRLKSVLTALERHLMDFESGANAELNRGLTATWNAGEMLLPEVAQSAGLRLSQFSLSSHTLDALKEFTFGRINSVSGDLYNKIRGELTLGVLGQKTPQEIAAELVTDIKSLPTDKQIPLNRFGDPIFKTVAERAEVITGTEMGRAFSLATNLSMQQAGETLPEMQKMWLHAGHPKVARQHHVDLHGMVKDMDKPFYSVSGVKIMFPRDPAAPIKEVIRCGCTHVPYMAAWGDAKDFAGDFDKKQHDLWVGKKE